MKSKLFCLRSIIKIRKKICYAFICNLGEPTPEATAILKG